MFRDMRRKKQELSFEQSVEILNSCTSGVLALYGDDGYPYAVPLSYCHCDGKLYFHCAKSGHKLDAIEGDSRCSFCVISQDDIVPERFTTFFKSVICFGKIQRVEDYDDKKQALNLLCDKYSPQIDAEARKDEISGGMNRVVILELTIEHMTGKQCIEQTKSANIDLYV